VMDLLTIGMACEWGGATGPDAFAAALRHGQQIAGPLAASAAADRPLPQACLVDTLVRVGADAVRHAALSTRTRLAVIIVDNAAPFVAIPASTASDALRAIVRYASPYDNRFDLGPAAIMGSIADALSLASTWLQDARADAIVIASTALLADPEPAERTPLPFSMAFDSDAGPPPIAEGAAAIVVARASAADDDGRRPRTTIRPVAADAPALVMLTGTREHEPAEEAWLARIPHDRARTLALGCVRATTGDAGAASDLGAVIAATLCARYRMLPAVPQWTAPRSLDLQEHPVLYVLTQSRYWYAPEDAPDRLVRITLSRGSSLAAIDVRTTGDAEPVSTTLVAEGGPLFFPLAADTSEELKSAVAALLARAASGNPLAELSRRCLRDAASCHEWPLACAFVARTVDELERDGRFLLDRLDRACAESTTVRTPSGSVFTARPLGRAGRVAFVYPGIGAAYVGLGRDLLLAIPHAFEAVTGREGPQAIVHWLRDDRIYPRCSRRLSPETRQLLDQDLGSDITNLAAVGMLSGLAYTEVLRGLLDVRPSMAFGFSLGELTMRCALGQWPALASQFAEALTPVSEGGLGGRMTAVRRYWQLPEAASDVDEAPADALWHSYVVPAPAADVVAACARDERVYVTAIHAPDEVMIGGDPAACARVLARTLSASAATAFRLPFALAWHSPPALLERRQLAALGDRPLDPVPDVVFYSAAMTAPVPQERAAIAHAIGTMAARRLDFPRLVRRVYEDGARVFVEAGVRSTCTHWIGATLDTCPHIAVPLDVKGVPSDVAWLRALAMLFTHRVPMNLHRVIADAPLLPHAAANAHDALSPPSSVVPARVAP